ncbi:MAG: hydantoinase B/oxoprolinase family protein [Bryobacteraceae bacterium]
MKRDPIEVELFRHLLASICEEMGIVLRRTAYSVNIKERRDYSCAIYDGAGETVAMGDHMPVHLGAMPASVRHVLDEFDLGPGDVALVNDPFRGGTHLPDITAVAGVFCGKERRPRFLLANRAHHADVGGMSPGSMPMAREIYQEGIRIPPILLVKGGKTDERLLDLILANVRTPDERRGDLTAQLMSIERGRTRLLEAVKRYGVGRVERNVAALCDYSERLMRARILALPDGDYRFEDRLDSDGITDNPVTIRVTIRIRGGEAEVDFTGTDRQAAGPVNANHAIATSAVMYVFRCLIAEEAPFTAGLMRPIRIVNPAGTVTNALPPAAMAAGNVETSQRITDVLLGALAKAAPGAIPAASSGTMNNLSFGGWDVARARPFAYYETIAGGQGASAHHDGRSATHSHMTNSLNTPIEAFEHEYPVRVVSYKVRSGSGGEGRHRGGDGIRKELEFLEPAEVTILADRRRYAPYGLAGGSPGRPGENRHNGERAPAKSRFAVSAGDRVAVDTPGGGGFGEKPDSSKVADRL